MVPLYAAGSVLVPCDVPTPSGADELLVVVPGSEAIARAAVGAAGERPASEHAETVAAAVKIKAPEKT
jgi:hypothetical protein